MRWRQGTTSRLTDARASGRGRAVAAWVSAWRHLERYSGYVMVFALCVASKGSVIDR